MSGPEVHPLWRWEGPAVLVSAGCALMTVVAVVHLLRASAGFERLFKELGVQVSVMTEWALNPVFHIVVGVALLIGVFLRHRAAWRAWVTGIWVVGLMAYMAFSQVALFEPLRNTLGASSAG